MIEKFLKSLTEESTKKVPVGKISEGLRKEFAENMRQKQQQIKIIEQRAKLMMAELEAEYDLAKYDERKAELWDKLYLELNILGEKQDYDYSVNRTTGEVSLEVHEDELEGEFTLNEEDFQAFMKAIGKKGDTGPLQ